MVWTGPGSNEHRIEYLSLADGKRQVVVQNADGPDRRGQWADRLRWPSGRSAVSAMEPGATESARASSRARCRSTRRSTTRARQRTRSRRMEPSCGCWARQIGGWPGSCGSTSPGRPSRCHYRIVTMCRRRDLTRRHARGDPQPRHDGGDLDPRLQDEEFHAAGDARRQQPGAGLDCRLEVRRLSRHAARVSQHLPKGGRRQRHRGKGDEQGRRPANTDIHDGRRQMDGVPPEWRCERRRSLEDLARRPA